MNDLFILISAFIVRLSFKKWVVVFLNARKHDFKMLNQESRHPRRPWFQYSSIMKMLWVK